MKTIDMFTDCLTYEQLQTYTSNKGNDAEREQIYKHISGCELCACAVNGFAALPFTSDDIVAIHREIDVRINATHPGPLTFAQVCILTASLVSIFGFYEFTNSFSENKIKISSFENEQSLEVTMPKSKAKFSESENNAIVEHKNERQIKTMENKILGNGMFPLEPLELINFSVIELELKSDNNVLQPGCNSDVIYIYDLKVADYNNLYFKRGEEKLFLNRHTESFKENKETQNNLIEKDLEQTIAADRVLKKGLEYFNKGKYNKAIFQFQVLIENNSSDLNAFFYSAMSYSKIGKYNLAIKNLETVLQNYNNAFHPEAKWNLALAYLKTNDKAKAKQLLMEIINDKGFYSKKAMEILYEDH